MDLDALDTVDVFDVEDEDLDVDLDQFSADWLAGTDTFHELASRRRRLDADVAGTGVLIRSGLAATAELGVPCAVIPDELGRFVDADPALFAHVWCGLWHGPAGEVCGAVRRDDLAELVEVCLLAGDHPAGAHGWERRQVTF